MDCPTLVFSRDNAHQSQLAETILNAVPTIREVVLGPTFLTVEKREVSDVEETLLEEEPKQAAACCNSTEGGMDRSSSITEGGMDRSCSDSAVGHPTVSCSTEERIAPEAVEGGMQLEAPLCNTDNQLEEKKMGQNQTLGEQNQTLSNCCPGETVQASLGQDTFFDKGQSTEETVEGIHEKIVAAGTINPETGATELNEEQLGSLFPADMDWCDLQLVIASLIMDHMYSRRPHVQLDAPHPHMDTLPVDGDSEIVLSIKELISQGIRPTIQEDGGDIRFVEFCDGDGMLVVELLGACKTCKSAKTTLRDLIERTTMHWIPEVKVVRELKDKKKQGAVGPQ